VGVRTATPRKVRLSMGVCGSRRASPSKRGNHAVRNLLENFKNRGDERAIAPRAKRDSATDLPDPAESAKLVARMQEV
jgi:hypothetical protein